MNSIPAGFPEKVYELLTSATSSSWIRKFITNKNGYFPDDFSPTSDFVFFTSDIKINGNPRILT